MEDENLADPQKSSIDRNLELLIDKKISDAKLLTSERRLGFILTIGAVVVSVFGIILPIILTFQSSIKVDAAIQRMEDKLTQLTDKLSTKTENSARQIEDKLTLFTDKSSNRVDSSIHSMEERFKEMVGRQLRKPKIECFIDGKNLAGSLLVFDPKHISQIIEIKNVGDGTTEQIRVTLYLQNEDALEIFDAREQWHISPINDRPEFAGMFVYLEERPSIIPAQASAAVPLGIITIPPIPTLTEIMKSTSVSKDLYENLSMKNIKARALLKIFYGEPMPKEVPFTLETRSK